MNSENAVERTLPSPEERRRIREEADLVLRRARELRERLEQHEQELRWWETLDQPAVWGPMRYESEMHLVRAEA